MITPRSFIVLCLLFGAFSCVCQKQNYFDRKVKVVAQKYNLNYRSEKDTSSKSNGNYRHITRKQIDKVLYDLEREWALFPDSVNARYIGYLQDNGQIKTTSEVLDSFYTNKNKQEFILKHKLKTSGMIFF
jgi:hypothetical protein